MVEIIRAGGLLMLPIILCSIVAIAIIIERFWSSERGADLAEIRACSGLDLAEEQSIGLQQAA